MADFTVFRNQLCLLVTLSTGISGADWDSNWRGGTVATVVTHRQALIDGRWANGGDGVIEVRSPHSGEVVGRVARCTAAQVDQAVAAAGKAFPAWKAMPLLDRVDLLYKAYELCKERNRRNGPYWFTGGFNLGAIVIWLAGVVVWLWLAGSTTLISWAQSFGAGISVYNVITASTPVILGCAVAYYLVGQRLGWALRSGPKADAVGAAVAARGASGAGTAVGSG
jgi:fermentation-respiration switch protein FrsA (DUF1100 family)